MNEVFFLHLNVFEYFQYAIGAFVFLIYAGLSCGFWLLAFLFVPETRRKTPERVQILVAKGTVYKAKHQL